MYFAAKENVELFKKTSVGSIIKFITISDVENLSIPKTDIFPYEELNKILFLIEEKKNETEKLVTLRDNLLPLLMNGQVEVR